MQYAEVIVDRRTSLNRPTFTYRIPPELLVRLEPGALLEVPFGEKKTLAVLHRLVRRSTRGELRTILRVINASALLPPHLFRLSRRLSAEYLEPLSKILFFMLPPLPKRQPTLPPFVTRQSDNQTIRKPALLIAPRVARYERYLIEIQATIKRGQSVILLVPDTTVRHLVPFIEELGQLQLQLTIMSGSLRSRERYLRWLRVRLNPGPQIIVGSFHAAFAPVTNLGLIIVEDEGNPLYKSEQSPRVHLREAALELARLQGSRIVLGGSVPSLESFARLQHHALSLASKPHVRWPNQVRLIVASGQDRLSTLTKSRIATALGQGLTVALFINRIRQRPCDACGHLLRPEAESCPACGANLSRFTLPAVRRELIRAFPEIPIATVAKGETEPGETQLLVGTHRLAELDRFDLGVICLSSLGLHVPDFRAEEYTLRRLIEFMELCDELIIQHFDERSRILDTIAHRSLTWGLKEILAERAVHHLPPAWRLVSLVYTQSQVRNSKLEIRNSAEAIITQLEGQLFSFNESTGRLLLALPPHRSPAGLQKFIANSRPTKIELDP